MPGSKIFAFNSLANARDFVNGDTTDKLIFECEATGVRPIRTRLSVWAVASEVEEFWTGVHRASFTIGAPVGCVGCKTLRIIKRIK